MIKAVAIVAVLVAASAVQAQDVVGLENCSSLKEADKKASCLQSNIDYLYRLIKRNDTAAQTKIREQAAALQAAIAKLGELRGEMEQLRASLDQLDKRVPRANAPPQKGSQ